MLFDGRLVETVKHTHKGTSFTNRQWRCMPEVNKGTFDAKRNVDSQCRAACLSTTAFSNGSSWLSNSTDVIKNRCASILNATVMCARSTVVDNGQVFVVLFTREVVTRSVVYC